MQKNQNCATQLAASLRELADTGSAVDPSAADTDTKDEPADIEIEQVASVHESRIFDLANGLTGYMFYSRVTNQTSRVICCDELDLCVFWEDSLFQWMPDPLETRGSEFYRFPGRGSHDLPRDQVLNHLLLERRPLPPRRPLEGWLLATGRPMPESLRDRQVLNTTLAIYASNGVEYTETIRLWIERLAVKPKYPTTGKSNLFGELLERPERSGIYSQSAQRPDELRIGKPATGPRQTRPFTT